MHASRATSFAEWLRRAKAGGETAGAILEDHLEPCLGLCQRLRRSGAEAVNGDEVFTPPYAVDGEDGVKAIKAKCKDVDW